MIENRKNMKNLVIALILTLAVPVLSFAQFSMGLKAGILSPREQYKDISVGTGAEAYVLAVNDIKFGTLAGIYLRMGKRIYLQPEVLFQSNRTDFQISTPGTGNEVIKRSTYNTLQLPLLLGFKMGPFRFHGGPVGNYHLSSNSSLSDIAGFSEEWKKLSWGWLGGVTIGGGGRFALDARYEGNFSRFGDQIVFGGANYSFDQRPSSFVLALNYALFH